MGATEANKEAEHNFIKGLNAAWFALKTLRDHDYDIDVWLDEYSPREAINEVGRIMSQEAAEKYGIRVSFEEAWCEKPPEKYVNPLEKRMTYKPAQLPIKNTFILKEYGELKVGHEVFDISQEEYAIIHVIHFDRTNDEGFVVLSNGYTFWTANVGNVIPINYGKKSIEDLHKDHIRRGQDHVIQCGDVVKILKVPDGCTSIEIGSYQVVDDHMCNTCYIYDDDEQKYGFTEDMYKLMT